MSSPETLLALGYLLSAVLFVVGLKRLSRVRTAPSGNLLAAGGMLVAVVVALIEIGVVPYYWIAGGLLVGGALGASFALKVRMTAMPELVARFNGLGGGASALVGLAFFWLRVIEAEAAGSPAATIGVVAMVTVVLSILIGAVTLGGSVVAELKLRGALRGGGRLGAARHAVTAGLAAVVAAAAVAGSVLPAGAASGAAVLVVALAALVLGVLLARPIGGADMPVVISLLNSLSGLAAAATGVVVGNLLLIIAGTFVGFAGLILTRIMCAAMNRSLAGVLFSGLGADSEAGESEYHGVRQAGGEEAAMILENAGSVVLVPGYGLAAGQAQHELWELAQALESRGAEVRFAIHPVAGRMPGHMNVVLAEADVPYDKLVEMERIADQLRHTDACVVVGANDVVNPAATEEPTSPIYGMPILPVHQARSVFVVKRSLAPGFAGIKNELFEQPHTMMLFGGAKDVLRDLTAELRESAGV